MGHGLLGGYSGRGPTGEVWRNIDLTRIKEDPSHGSFFFDDFHDFPLVGTQTTEIAHGRDKVFNTGAAKVIGVSAVNSVEKNGGLLSLPVDTDNDSASLAQSYPSFRMSGVASTGGKLVFECRLAFTPITTNGIGWMIGLAETELWTLATGVPFNGGDAITNAASFIGFRKEEDGLGVIDSVTSDRATSFTNVGDAEASVAAYTFIKLGMVYDPYQTSRCVRFFADGVEMATALTNAQLVAMTNLDANALGLIVAVVADSAGTSGNLILDWWQVAQEFAA